jgi:AmmeMemoRadiSam system protein A
MKKKSGSEVFQDLLDYRTSHEITGDDSGSVSYAAAGYFPAGAFALDTGEAESLLDAAQESLREFARCGARRPALPRDPNVANHTAPGVFVTLRHKGQLRGCLGRVGGDAPLRECVPELALSAALDDTRFAPCDRDACAELDIEISVLTPRKRVRNRQNLQPGVHGAMLERGSCNGLILPQVGRRERWTRESFLRMLAAKAGLAENEWNAPDASLSVFQAFQYEREMTRN